MGLFFSRIKMFVIFVQIVLLHMIFLPQVYRSSQHLSNCDRLPKEKREIPEMQELPMKKRKIVNVVAQKCSKDLDPPLVVFRRKSGRKQMRCFFEAVGVRDKTLRNYSPC